VRRTEQLVCLVPVWDPWMQNMLRPLVEAAGYRVIDDPQDEAADVVIASLGEELPEDASGKTIWLRSEPDSAGKKDQSIYRYDRAALLMALKTAGAGRGK
jgi:two-component system chemotaxis sensor kinase CheA